MSKCGTYDCEVVAQAAEDSFTLVRSWDVLCSFMQSHGFDPGVSSWLHIGYGKCDLVSVGESCFWHAVAYEPRLTVPGCKIPYRSNDFDLITASCLFGRIPPEDRLDFMIEISRVLRPGGTACILEANPLHPATLLRRTLSSGCLAAGDLTALARNSGLTGPRVAYFNCLPDGLYAQIPFVETMLSRVPAGRDYAVFAGKQVPSTMKGRARMRPGMSVKNLFNYGSICAT